MDVNKGDHEQPNYRSRFVATELKAGSHSLDHFAAMPPSEAKKALFPLEVTKNSRKERGARYKPGFIDISKAYLYAPVKREAYIQLPEEDYEHGMRGRLVYSLYGTRDAAQNWEREYTQCLENIGFIRKALTMYILFIATACAYSSTWGRLHDPRARRYQ